MHFCSNVCSVTQQVMNLFFLDQLQTGMMEQQIIVILTALSQMDVPTEEILQVASEIVQFETNLSQVLFVCCVYYLCMASSPFSLKDTEMTTTLVALSTLRTYVH